MDFFVLNLFYPEYFFFLHFHNIKTMNRAVLAIAELSARVRTATLTTLDRERAHFHEWLQEVIVQSTEAVDVVLLDDDDDEKDVRVALNLRSDVISIPPTLRKCLEAPQRFGDALRSAMVFGEDNEVTVFLVGRNIPERYGWWARELMQVPGHNRVEFDVEEDYLCVRLCPDSTKT